MGSYIRWRLACAIFTCGSNDEVQFPKLDHSEIYIMQLTLFLFLFFNLQKYNDYFKSHVVI
jgi:hypothetical protein